MFPMATVTERPQPSPAFFFEAVNAYQTSACLRGALDLDLFTASADGPATAQELARRCEASERGTRILCDYLTVTGFLTKNGDRYALTPESAAFLNKKSPVYLGSAIHFLHHSMLTDCFRDVAAIVRRGGTLMGREGTMAPDHPVWVEFAHDMAPIMALPAQFIASLLNAPGGERWKVLDIAAGHGLFGITLAEQNPNAEIYAVDWSHVLQVAQQNAQKHGVDKRYHTISGSAFEVDLGTGYDVALVPNFLHHFDPPTCETLLRRLHAALKPDGRVVTLEFVPNADRISPPIAAKFSMMMLGSTERGDAYTHEELASMLRNAGFPESEGHRPPAMDASEVIVSRKSGKR
jgi:2-polyprenyl-3-methyl-5-hydroxy-6-metoxy-1,4-benzoquinol methylase